jgi:hypothetical protein
MHAETISSKADEIVVLREDQRPCSVTVASAVDFIQTGLLLESHRHKSGMNQVQLQTFANYLSADTLKFEAT